MSAPLTEHPATLLPAGEGRRGDLLPAPSPEISAAHTPVKRKLTSVVSVPPARVCSLARANSSASGPRLSPRTLAGASGRNSHQPVTCGGTGCASPSAAAWKSQTRNSFCEHLGQRLAVDRASQSSIVPASRSSDRPALFPPQLFEAADNDGFSAHPPVKRKLTGVVSVPPARVCSLARANSPGAPASGVLSRSPAGASGRNSHQPVSCGGTGCVLLSADTLEPSAITADPRRADPGNPLAGAVSVLRRLPNWPVALRGGGHIAGVV